MIGGFTPFRSPDPTKTFDNILMLKINWPRNADKITKDLIQKMLVIEPEMRISIDEIKSHSFMSNIDWDLVKGKKLDPPFIPDLETIYSLEHFKNDNKMEMYDNPLFEFFPNQNTESPDTKITILGSPERKFNKLGQYHNQKIDKMLADF